MHTQYNDDGLTIWNHAGDYATQKKKPGKDKRLNNKSERKAQKAFRNARNNRHTF